jgi:exodeoxyribonuclease-3
MIQSIISYNVNGIRAAIKKGFFDWLQLAAPDVICVQETKARLEDVDTTRFSELGYSVHWHAAEKKGYSGVATFSRQQPDLVVAGCGMEVYDREGRILRTDFGDTTLLNCYFPSGTSGEERQAFKMQFLGDFFQWAMELKKSRPNLIIVGDYNIAHSEIDIHDPKGNKNSSGFLPEERQWMTKWLSEGGFTDAFRHLNPDKKEYSWWSARFNSRANNKGWRIDYQCVCGEPANYLGGAGQLTDVVHSDHCPVLVNFYRP